ncbi:MAG: hypothetical protein U5N26_04645 [Candidatus Marinimicrobia bacterium]|nr:hypothetical protein [Candidatus Neomarinimicrobiota bacterium]
MPRDNLNTDGIYPGKYTYMDGMSSKQQAEVVMENYDPDFVNIVGHGDILAGGFRFRHGEFPRQAATALMHKGIRLLIAGSFSETYKRNAINNGFIVIECPGLIRDLKKAFQNQGTTVNTRKTVNVDFEQAEIRVEDKHYHFAPLGRAAQQLVVEGGLLNKIKKA